MLTDEMRMDGPAFTYHLPIEYAPYESDGMPPFAVGPGNPKYYEKSDDVPAAADMSDTPYPIDSNRADIDSYKVKAPMNVDPKILTYDDALNMDTDNSEEMSPSKDVFSRDDLRNMLQKWENEQAGNDVGGRGSDDDADAAILLQSNSEKLQADVEKKPVDLDSAWVIGVIAGVSAAFTVGLLAIGIGWYT